MAEILICYYSRTGHTEHMAEAIADAARQVEGANVTVRSVDDVEAEHMLDYDAIVLGSPTYYGSMAAQVKKLIDDSVAFHGRLAGRVGGAFTSSANIGGGNETAIMDMLKALLIHGMIVPGMATGDHYGPVAIGDLDERAGKQCARYGRTLAELTVRLRS